MLLISVPHQTSKPPSINLSPSSFLSHTATAALVVVHRPPSEPHTSSKLLHTTQAAITSSTPCLGRLAISPLVLYQPLHRHCSAAALGPALSDSSGRSPIVLYNFSVAPQDRHTQEEPLHLFWAAHKLVLAPNVAVHCHDHQGPLVVQEGRVPTGSTKRQAQEVESPTEISDL